MGLWSSKLLRGTSRVLTLSTTFGRTSSLRTYKPATCFKVLLKLRACTIGSWDKTLGGKQKRSPLISRISLRCQDRLLYLDPRRGLRLWSKDSLNWSQPKTSSRFATRRIFPKMSLFMRAPLSVISPVFPTSTFQSGPPLLVSLSAFTVSSRLPLTNPINLYTSFLTTISTMLPEQMLRQINQVTRIWRDYTQQP